MERRRHPPRVQFLVDGGVSAVPFQYIRPFECRPDRNRGTLDISVPVVDLFDFDPAHSDEVRHHIRRACLEWGAFQAVNHGVPKSLIDEIKYVGRAFFDAPIEDKLKYSCDPNSAASEGYGSRMLSSDDGALDWRDYFDHHTLPESRREPARWPDSPANYRHVVLEYSDHMKVVAQRLLRVISESLSLRSSYFEEMIGEVYQNITISYYPPCPQPDLAIGLQPHSDMGVLTLLVQDEIGGLEVLKDDKWAPLGPINDAVVAIVADQTEIISNGEYASCVHRALVNCTHSRLSVASFYDPSKTTKISPASQLVTRCGSLKYKEVVYGDYISAWYRSRPDGKRNIDALRS